MDKKVALFIFLMIIRIYSSLSHKIIDYSLLSSDVVINKIVLWIINHNKGFQLWTIIKNTLEVHLLLVSCTYIFKVHLLYLLFHWHQFWVSLNYWGRVKDFSVFFSSSAIFLFSVMNIRIILLYWSCLLIWIAVVWFDSLYTSNDTCLCDHSLMPMFLKTYGTWWTHWSLAWVLLHYGFFSSLSY